MGDAVFLADISLIVLSHNRCQDLERNLTLLLTGPLPQSLELIVVDNASSDGSVEMLKRFSTEHPAMRLLLMESNLGVAGGRNAGYRAARGKYLVCLDDDSTLAGEDLAKVPALFAEFLQAGILAFRVCHLVSGEPQNDHGEQARPVANFHGAGYALRRELLERVGYLDDECTFGGEEIDLSIRAYDAGFLTIYTPAILVKHNSFLRSGKIGADRRARWVYNYLRVLFKHFPRSRAALFGGRLLVSHLWSGLREMGPSIVPRLLSAAFRGMCSGRKTHRGASPDTLVFYSDPDLRPELGNVPLRVKLGRKFGWCATQ